MLLDNLYGFLRMLRARMLTIFLYYLVIIFIGWIMWSCCRTILTGMLILLFHVHQLGTVEHQILGWSKLTAEAELSSFLKNQKGLILEQCARSSRELATCRAF